MRESEIINLFLRHLKRQGNLPLGDDAGAIKLGDEWLVATNDMLVRKTDVPGIMTPEQVGFKAVTMNVSDVAAMGARPIGFLFSLGVPGDVNVEYLEGVARGIGKALEFYGIPVLSADTNEADDLIIDGIALGRTRRLLTRSGARPGDLVCVTGDLGRALAGLLVWKHELKVKARVRNALYEKLLEPRARVEEGTALSGVATSAIDVSDGLSKELHVIAEMSGVGIEVEAERIPVRREVLEAAEVIGAEPLSLALASGEEFELTFTIRPELAESLDFECTVIGRVFSGAGVYITTEGKRQEMPVLGWEHLSRGENGTYRGVFR
ncbi:thiamine monophosphate kinase [Thermococcus cleftensis]|uniref:Thiamine-monophosphate kinase n=1 Tax=Thermococcus cleftensis (strain DSM 27260 / KACC 17922 / CL1) TaxID=163003 RepID=I3ZRZ8_THECF|nr:thiamine-phosphate kinase [Thermococcus cleftensis]AFL94482.1 thiamine monophosphate kinase [Thermococcus cleftensis]